MRFPLSFWDISLWLAITAIILLATAELISPYYGQTNVIIEKKRLRSIALILGILFMLTVLMRVYEMIASP
ncbi:MAG: hypothetical protein ACTSUS_04165 [Candidatus Freyarchaeota archaeon]